MAFPRIIPRNQFKPNLIGNLWISYIGTIFKLNFIQDSGLFRVMFIPGYTVVRLFEILGRILYTMSANSLSKQYYLKWFSNLTLVW